MDRDKFQRRDSRDKIVYMNSAEGPNLLDAKGITMRFGGLVALSDVSVSVQHRSVTGLVGPNGAGKSTLFSILSGLQVPVEGQVFFGGTEVTSWSPEKRSRVGMARTFQHPEMFQSLTIREHVALADRMHNSRSRLWKDLITLKGFGRTVRGETERVDEILDLLNLSGDADRLAHGLPLGTSRLVEVARAMALQPKLILLDEPCSGLDQTERDQLVDALERMVETSGVSLLIVEHDFEVVVRLAKAVFVLDFGVLIASGTPSEVRGDPAVQAAYLGDVSAAVGD
jgi:branched-chain amino acid transport system ATP-binding protein